MSGYDFTLDPFQQRAIAALDEGRSVLVAAPTGSGKTVVAEHAVAKALAEGGKAFYTAPIKALSNQKYADLARRHGVDRVGLLTGDNAINGDAPIVVMTTEVLRNMLYAASPTLRPLLAYGAGPCTSANSPSPAPTISSSASPPARCARGMACTWAAGWCIRNSISRSRRWR